MTPKELTTLELKDLREEIRVERVALSAHREAVVSHPVDASSREERLAFVALTLHNYYNAVEAIVERILRRLGVLPDTSFDYHRKLLEAAARPIQEVRPAIIRAETYHRLKSLQGFRHFLRHAYAVSLDWSRLGPLCEDLLLADKELTLDLDTFDQFLVRLIGEI